MVRRRLGARVMARPVGGKTGLSPFLIAEEQIDRVPGPPRHRLEAKGMAI